MDELKLIKEINTLTKNDLTDIRRALTESYNYLENAIRNVQILNEEIYHIFRQSEILSRENYVLVGVYSVTKNKKESLIYHIVSDINYEFKDIINSNWVLLYSYELEICKPLKINRFVIDLEYWLSKNTAINNI